MNVEKLKRLQAQVRIGGKGTPRRKKKVTHQTAAADDKKLQSCLKKLSVSTIPGIEEVNIIKDDLTVIHFNNPKAQASLSANTFAVTGHGETKKVVEMLPEILPQLGQETVVQLRMFASSMTNNQKIDGLEEEKLKSNLLSNNDDDVPMLVSDFDEIAKSEVLTTGKMKLKSDKSVSFDDNSLKSNVAQDVRLDTIDSNAGEQALTLDSDVNIEANSVNTSNDSKDLDETLLVIESALNKDQIQQKHVIIESDVKSDKEKTQLEENKTTPSSTDKKSATNTVGQKKDKGGKRGSDPKKGKEAHQANKNKSELIDSKEDVNQNKSEENVLSQLTQANEVALKSEIILQTQNTKIESERDALPTPENNQELLEVIAEKQSDNTAHIEAKGDENRIIEEESVVVNNELLIDNQKLSSIEPKCTKVEEVKTANKDLIDDIKPIQEEMTVITDATEKDIEQIVLADKTKVEPAVSNEFNTIETNSNEASKVNTELNNISSSSCPPLLQESNVEKNINVDDSLNSQGTSNSILSLEMNEFDNKPKDVVEKDPPLNQTLKEPSIIADLQTTNVVDMNKILNTDLILNIEEKTPDNVVINQIMSNEIREAEIPQGSLEDTASNLTTVPKDTKTEEIANENKIQMPLKPPEDESLITVAKTDSEQTIEVANENKIQTEGLNPDLQVLSDLIKNETLADEIKEKDTNNDVSQAQILSENILSKTEIEQKSQQTSELKGKDINLEDCSIIEEHKNKTEADDIQKNVNNDELLKAQNLSIEQTSELKGKDTNSDDCFIIEHKNETKADDIQKNLNNDELLKAQNLSTEIPPKTGTEQKLLQADDQKNTETSLILSQDKEKDNSVTECLLTEEENVRTLAAAMSTELVSSENKIENNTKTSSEAVKQPTPKKNETKKQSPQGNSKSSAESKKTDIGVKSKQTSPPKTQAHQKSDDTTSIPKTQQLPKSAASGSIKPEKQTTSQKTKQQPNPTLSSKTQNTVKIKSGSATPPSPIKQKVSGTTKVSTDLPATTDSTVPTNQSVGQTPSIAENPKSALSSAEMGKTETKKNAAETAIKAPMKTSDQISATTETSQKQQTPKTKQPKPTDISIKGTTTEAAVTGQITPTAEKPKTAVSSTETHKTATKKNASETSAKQTSATPAPQKQLNQKAKQAKSSPEKSEPTSKPSQPKSKPSKKPTNG